MYYAVALGLYSSEWWNTEYRIVSSCCLEKWLKERVVLLSGRCRCVCLYVHTCVLHVNMFPMCMWASMGTPKSLSSCEFRVRLMTIPPSVYLCPKLNLLTINHSCTTYACPVHLTVLARSTKVHTFILQYYRRPKNLRLLSYSLFCNVLHTWHIRLIPTYRV